MIAYRFHPGEKKLVREEVEKPKAGPNDVILEVRAAGVCHSDLHILDGEVPFLKNVFTLGHEACGVLVEKGSEVPDSYEEGKLYAVHGPNPCGNCHYCRTGRDNLCDNPARSPIGLGTDGAYADFVKVPARNLVEVPEGVSPEIAAVATDAVLTPYHALKTLADVRQGDSVLIIGLGGLGSNGLQVAKTLGAYVTATDQRQSSLELGRKLGADEVIDSKNLDSLKGKKFDVVADFVGLESTYRQAESLVKPGGTILAIGLASPQVPFNPMNVATYQYRIQGSFWGTSVELKEVLNYVAEGKIKPQVEHGALEEVNHWLDELRQGKVRSRMALRPKAAEAEKTRAA